MVRFTIWVAHLSFFQRVPFPEDFDDTIYGRRRIEFLVVVVMLLLTLQRAEKKQGRQFV